MKDNAQYWINRHDRLSDRLASVGDITKSEEENISLYAHKKREVVDILRSLDSTDLRGTTVLDAGCGTGVIGELLWSMGAEVFGIDVSAEALRQAALRVPFGIFLQSPLTTFDFQRQYDIVFCADVLYHLIDNEAWTRTIKRLVEHVARGGYLVILEQLKQNEEMAAAHVHFRTLSMYRGVLRDMGLIEQRVERASRCLVWYRP
jgi:2-polyprenyl-3-methyl-5-hydroxy-6-metoxy-1,4-benzoquinol methylase